ncbi:PAS domain-containing protein [Halobaculum sp. WSA2]|uniref:histidine kinase n=1 Tax=Halobaculum saliterrae TaxID=2073113 RepID=A0A6B0SR63_9EURY|nr:HAMP domain-containing sensor histidine kinase [Halobaculum saliterrae]MXR41428.1 PAS domain-containing protein [Halobaculum saliterrae]
MTWQSGRLALVVLAGGVVVVLVAVLVSDSLRGRARNAVAAALDSVAAWASAAAVRYGDDGSTRSRAAAASVARDAAVDAATEGLIVVDGDGMIVACNSVAADALGHTRGAAVGEPIEALDPELDSLIDDSTADSSTDGDSPVADPVDGDIPTEGDSPGAADGPERGRLVADAVRDVTATAGSDEMRGGSSRLARMTDEGKRHYDVHVNPFERSGLRGRVVVLRDVTDRHRLRRRIGVLNRLLRHDLRNEMNVVLGYAEQIEDRLRERAGKEDAVDDEMETAIDRITGAAETMLDRAETVRHVEATLDADGSTLTRLDVVGLVRAQVDGLTMEYRSIDPQVTVDAPDSAWITATGLVDTVFENLLENAIEHSHRERPVVEVSVEESEEFVAVTVADDGPGIPSQELRTFQSESETAVTHSSGLGLWLVVWITEASGGRVSFDVDETGTAVTVEFPAADPPE